MFNLNSDFNTFLIPPKGYTADSILLLTYSLNLTMVDEVIRKSKIVNTDLVYSVGSMLEILSLQYFQSFVTSNLGENAKYYLGDNYFGISINDENGTEKLYYLFEENTSVISEVGYKEAYANGDISNQLFFKKCSPISVKAPKDADSYATGDLPDFGALA